MKLILRSETNPYFNIAAEEYFLKNFDEEWVMIWQSSPSIVVGKHQNTIAEVNQEFANSNNIPIIRRISGGGTVYHDEGNINYSIITKSENREQLVDFVKFTQPIVNFLQQYGIEATFEGKNNLKIGAKKFSGNSAHVYKNRVLHHGTLLFNTNLDNLEKSITPANYSIKDKAVKSIRAVVTNLADELPSNFALYNFKKNLTSFFSNYFNVDSVYQLTENDKQEINKLIETKYKLWDWNYGYSPTYQFQKTIKSKGKDISIWLEVKKGIIVDLQINSSIITEELNNLILKSIINKLHHPSTLFESLKQIDNQLITINMDSNFIKNLLF